MLTHTAMYVVFVLDEKINQGKAPSLTAAIIPKFLKNMVEIALKVPQ